jgi:hypothetical protein
MYGQHFAWINEREWDKNSIFISIINSRHRSHPRILPGTRRDKNGMVFSESKIVVHKACITWLLYMRPGLLDDPCAETRAWAVVRWAWRRGGEGTGRPFTIADETGVSNALYDMWLLLFIIFFLLKCFFIIFSNITVLDQPTETFSRYCFFIIFFLVKCFISTASSPCDVWLHYRSLVSSFWSVVEYKCGKLK